MTWPTSITHNLGWKIVSLVLAALVWLTINSEVEVRSNATDLRTFFRLPVTVMTVATNERAYRVVPSSAEVTVRGESELLATLHAADIQVFVNLTALADGKGGWTRIQAHTPAGVSLLRIRPPEAFVESLTVPPNVPVAKPSL